MKIDVIDTVRGEPLALLMTGHNPLPLHKILPPLREGVRGKVRRFTSSLTLPLKGEGI
jgi:hypothetical protein